MLAQETNSSNAHICFELPFSSFLADSFYSSEKTKPASILICHRARLQQLPNDQRGLQIEKRRLRRKESSSDR
ncbi:hypothetical protein L596_010561 [Steinernema carpocapsae]|uniref:Uncharacterized protein n=1 Tax=Steinernema carpocapsae TaxID=34508 RepID=A0A4U5PJ02_STECR|nr:hypothetical protein L596_010561 [Steinernema carpocapsae]